MASYILNALILSNLSSNDSENVKRFAQTSLFCDNSFLLVCYTVEKVRSQEKVGVSLRQTQTIKNLMLSVHVAVKTLNLEVSGCYLTDNVKEMY